MLFKTSPPPGVARYGAAYASSAAVTTANSPLTIVAPATNTAGVIVWNAQLTGLGAGGNTTPRCSILAKASAPTGVFDGDVLVLGLEGSAAGRFQGRLIGAVFVPPGKGIYYNADNIEQTSWRSVLYTVLP